MGMAQVRKQIINALGPVSLVIRWVSGSMHLFHPHRARTHAHKVNSLNLIPTELGRLKIPLLTLKQNFGG